MTGIDLAIAFFLGFALGCLAGVIAICYLTFKGVFDEPETKA